MSDSNRSYRREFNPFTSLRVHWKAAVLIFVLAAIGLGKWMKDRDQVLYTSYATLHVSRTFPRTLQMDRELDLNSSYDFDSFRNDQVALLFRPDVIEAALRSCGQLGAPWAPNGSDPNYAVMGFSSSLYAYAVSKSSRIEINLQSTDKNAVQPALDALLAAFTEAHRKEYFFAQDKRPETLQAALDLVQQDIDDKRAEINGLSQELKVTSFEESTGNPLASALEEARLAISQARRDLSAAEINRDALKDSLANADSQGLAAGTDWASLPSGLSDVLAPLAAQHSTLGAELAGLGDTHPGRSSLERQMRGIEEQMNEILDTQEVARLQEANVAVDRATATLASLETDLGQLEGQNSTFLSKFQRGRILEEELPRDLEQRARLSQRLEFFQMEAQSPSYAQIFQSATEVDPRGESQLMKDLTMAVLIAFLVALLLPVLWDLRDDRVHTLGDVQRALGFAPSGWVPGPTSGRLSVLAEGQIRRFAMSLDRDRRRHGAHMVVLTGVSGHSADLDFVAHVANELGQLGRKVLVVDAADADKGQGKAGGGLLGLLAGGPMEAVPRSGAGDFLPYGKAEGDLPPAWDEWAHKVETATQAYDLVLVVAPALLSAPIAEALIADAPLAVLVVTAETQSLGEVRRAGQVMESLHPEGMGAVLIKAKPFRGRGYYRELAREAGA